MTRETIQVMVKDNTVQSKEHYPLNKVLSVNALSSMTIAIRLLTNDTLPKTTCNWGTLIEGGKFPGVGGLAGEVNIGKNIVTVVSDCIG